MESGGGRSAEERKAAAEARARAREGEPAPGDEDLVAGGGEPARAPEGISRYNAGGDIYGRRRAIAIGAAVVVVLLLIVFLLL